MDWKSIGQTVAKVAPVLGTVLGGPVGLVAGAAGSLLGSFLGVEPTPAAIGEAIKDPETLLKIRELEIAQQARLLDWQEAQLQAELANVQGARQKEVELAKTGHLGAWATPIVALVVISGFFWMLHEVVSLDAVNEPALILLGSLSTAFGAVVNYYLGSSLGSARKDATNPLKR